MNIKKLSERVSWYNNLEPIHLDDIKRIHPWTVLGVTGSMAWALQEIKTLTKANRELRRIIG